MIEGVALNNFFTEYREGCKVAHLKSTLRVSSNLFEVGLVPIDYPQSTVTVDQE
jgi:hypothetical protein